MNKKKKRVLLIATTPFISDGLTKIELDVLNYNRDEIEFTIASRFGYDTEIGQKLIMDDDFHCVTLPSKKHLFRYQKSIEKIVEYGDFDTVYIHGNSAMMYFEAHSAKKAGARVVTHCHNTKSNYPLVDRLIKRSFNKCVDVKIACSQYVADFAYDGERVELILNGPDVEKFGFDEQKREEVRNQFGWKNNHFIVGHVGRFNPQKNHHKLIEIFEEIHKKNQNARLLLIGEGELLEEIQNLVKTKDLTSYATFVKNTDHVEDYFNAMDCMVMPSLHEGLCLVALEAQANGMPVFVADTFSPETLATESACEIGLGKSAVEWANVILEVDLARKMNKDVLQFKSMTWEDMMKRLRKIL